jgi:hypothetical protein
LTLLWAARAAHSQSLTNNLELIPDDDSFWKESLLWDKNVVLRAGFGYKDNVLLSPSSPIGSGFFTSGIDLTIFRLPLDGWEVNCSVVGDDVRYFRSVGGMNGEDLFLGSAQVQRYFGGVWRTGLDVRGSYVDQVLQELVVTGGVQAVEARGEMLSMRPFVRRDLSTNWWVQIEAPESREWWQAPLDSSWKLGGQAAVGLNAGRSTVELSGGGFYVPHDEWLARTSSGAEIPGQKLVLWRQVAELRWDRHWDARRRWSSGTRFGFNHSRDNGGGYYDYYRYALAQDVRYRDANWEAKVSAGLSYYHFPIQTIDVPPAPTLHLTTLNITARIERRLYKNLRGFGAFEYEQTVSNDPLSEYRDKIFTGGLSWEF